VTFSQIRAITYTCSDTLYASGKVNPVRIDVTREFSIGAKRLPPLPRRGRRQNAVTDTACRYTRSSTELMCSYTSFLHLRPKAAPLFRPDVTLTKAVTRGTCSYKLGPDVTDRALMSLAMPRRLGISVGFLKWGHALQVPSTSPPR
jgi:hypothetical protein